MRNRNLAWIGIALGVLLFPRPEAHAWSPVRTPDSRQVVGNGVYPAASSACYSQPGEWTLIPMTPASGLFMTAPNVVGVFWPPPPGGSGPDPHVRTLFGDFATDLFNGPYWNAVMPQYIGSAHGIYQSSVDLTTLLTLTPSATVYVASIGPELDAQVQAGVLPPYDATGNTIYAVHFPPGITITDVTTPTHVSIGTSCVQWCGYHDFHFQSSPFELLTWTVLPDFSQNAACAASCGQGTPFHTYMQVQSHELFETVTDPYSVGWVNRCPGGGEEVADVCELDAFFVPRRTFSSGSPQCPTRWSMQSIFSNASWAAVGAPNGCLVSDSTAVSDLTISMSHSGNFAQGQIGDHYRISVSNAASAGAACGLVTVTETLPPSGLTLTGMSGNGWTCAGNTCTRSDALSASSSYPDITVTVTVAANSPASVTNSASVSGGDEINTANDAASDPTTINPGSAAGCNDNNVCTTDAFNAATGCVYTNVSGPCDDGSACTTGDTCSDGTCVGVPIVPDEVGNDITVTQTGGGTTISWPGADGPFSLYRGSIRSGTPHAYNHGCMEQEVNVQSATDVLSPPPGVALYYLVTRVQACGESIPGRASDGKPIPNSHHCPDLGADSDGDGILDQFDDCPTVSDPGQSNADGDGYGDACDNCPTVSNPTQRDMNHNGLGDACDPDIDGDGIPNALDNCPYKYNPDQVDTDGDGVGDACDNCSRDYNPSQHDCNFNNIGDACDPLPCSTGFHKEPN